MAVNSVATKIRDIVEENWGLISPAVDDIDFSVEWFDARATATEYQVTITHWHSPPARWFGPLYPEMPLKAFITDRYQANIWVRIPRGDLTRDQELVAWNMKNEVWRLLNANRDRYTLPVGLVIPLDYGRQLNEGAANRTPRLLRWMIEVQATMKT